MALIETVDQRKEKIFKLLKDDKVTTIVLAGESGIGKTWMAKQISERAISNDLFDITLWIFLNRKYNSRALYENIACQFSLLSSTEEWEDNGDDDDNREVEREKEGSFDKLKQKIFELLVGKRCLLILDGNEGNNIEEEEISKLKSLLSPDQKKPCKVLITTRNKSYHSSHIIEEEANEVIQIIKPLCEEERSNLLSKSVSEFRESAPFKAIVENSKGMPAVIVLIAEALNNLRAHKSEVWILENALEEAANNIEIDGVTLLPHYAMLSSSAITDCSGHIRQFVLDLPSSVMTDCLCYSKQLFRNRGSVHYNELITYWIMEGYLDPIDHIEKAYEEGHGFLMELVKRGMLKEQEDNTVFIEGALLEIVDHRQHGFDATAKLGLPNVFMNGEWEGIGRVIQMDGIIKTLCISKNGQTVSTLLLDENRLCRELGTTFFQLMERLQVLVLFHSKFKSLPSSLSNLQNLLVLVLRGCDFLDEIDHIRGLKALNVLEISDARYLKKVPDNLFEQIPNLRSLNLSAVPITKMPSSLFKQSELRWLILRKCSCLETLPSLHEFKNLELLDLAGATTFKAIGHQKISDVKKLHTLNLSQTRISRLPFFENHQELTRLLLTGCSCLKRLPSLKQLNSLQIIDLSYATDLKEISDRSLIHLKDLRYLNLSKTQVITLPSLSNLGNLRQLLLKDCSLLLTLPEMKGLTRLEVLDLSGCISLKELEGQHLNHANLRQLLLPGCLNLVKLPDLIALKKLEVLDLSGCSALTAVPDKSFECMTRLLRINLSETKIEFPPSLSNYSNLCRLTEPTYTSIKTEA